MRMETDKHGPAGHQRQSWILDLAGGVPDQRKALSGAVPLSVFVVSCIYGLVST